MTSKHDIPYNTFSYIHEDPFCVVIRGLSPIIRHIIPHGYNADLSTYDIHI